MFYQGDLQSGISLAVQQSKPVLCFVCDSTAESRTWEEEYLKHYSIAHSLQNEAVLLRIEAGSREAGYLSAFCPINKAPMAVVIKDGQLLEILSGETTQEEFTKRLQSVLIEGRARSALLNDSRHPNEGPVSEPEAPPLASPSTSNTLSSQAIDHAYPSPIVQDLLHDRRNRLEAETKAQEAAEKAKRAAKAKSRREEAEAELAEPSLGSSERKGSDYAEQQRKRLREAKQERERILKLVENDKAERKAKQECRKALAREETTEASSSTSSSSKLGPRVSTGMGSPGSRSVGCAIQVRLLDGSTINTRFPVQGTVRNNVRRWVDESRTDGDTPYTFRQILIPLPNRAITISEEEETLQALGLAPSATLIMTPVQDFTDAYGNAGQGIVSKGLAAGYSVLSSGVGIVTATLRPFLGAGIQATPVQEVNPHANPSAKLASQIPSIDDAQRRRVANDNVRTLHDPQTDYESRQLYNGNQLNFEPGPNDDRKDD